MAKCNQLTSLRLNADIAIQRTTTNKHSQGVVMLAAMHVSWVM